MPTYQPPGSDWSDEEIDTAVADYFEMLQMDLLGAPYVKSHRNAALHEAIGRSRGSIEFKHQNISAVLRKLGLPWILGYKPMPNYQRALLDGIERFLDANKSALIPLSVPSRTPGLADAGVVYLEPPPGLAPDSSAESASLERLIRKFDPAERDARNRALGKSGEEMIFYSEMARLSSGGRADLARKVSWVSQERGDGAGYDILSFSADGRELLLEVKTTSGAQTTPFFLSENERLLSVERPEAFRIRRLYDFVREPRAFELVPPLIDSVLLSPAVHKASFS